MPLISIIIPVYQAEKYLAKCIDSIINQTFRDWELILVNDGSTDKSTEICNDYSLYDNRIIVIHQQNKGASAARNTGLNHINGKFICFVDSDDYVNENYLYDLYHDMVSENCKFDLVIHGMTRICNNQTIDRGMHYNGNFDLTSNPAAFFKSINIERYGGPVCKLFKCEIVKEYNILFNEKIKLAEDLDFMLRYYLCCSSIKTSEKNNYFYIDNPVSATTKINNFESEFYGLNEIYNAWHNLYKKFPIKELKNIFYRSVSYLTHRTLFSIYHHLPSRKERLYQLKSIDTLFIDIYKNHYLAKTPFLKLTKFLFCNKFFRSLDIVLSIRLSGQNNLRNTSTTQ